MSYVTLARCLVANAGRRLLRFRFLLRRLSAKKSVRFQIARHTFLVSVLALRIYLVEDNAIIRENLAAALAELANTTMCGSADGEKIAAAWLKANPDEWDLAIVDVFLKEGNGIGVVAAGKTRRADQGLVVLTNYASSGVREQCLKLGADAVFDKSHDIDNLVDFCLQQSASQKKS